MKKFILHLYQENGCDYTIGCGHSIEEFEAPGIEEARVQLKRRIEDHGRDQINEAIIYEVAYTETIDIDDLFAEDDAEDAACAKEKREEF